MSRTYLYLLGFLFILLFTSCDQTQSKNINQLNELDSLAIYDYKQKLIRYIGRMPEGASQENKFHAYFDAHYKNQLNNHELMAFHQVNGHESYFLFSRIAPSIKLKKVAIGGKVSIDDNGEVAQIEEVFRTWKQIPDTLEKRALMLFKKMVQGENLSPYYTENTGNTDYIEFPNQEVWYDQKKQHWASSREDVLSEFKEAKIEKTKQKIKEFEQSAAYSSEKNNK